MHKECLNPNLAFKSHTDSVLVSNIDTTVRTGIYESSKIGRNFLFMLRLIATSFPPRKCQVFEVSRKSPPINS